MTTRRHAPFEPDGVACPLHHRDKERCSMVDPLFAEIARLHRAIHARDPVPANERERQADYIFSGVQRLLLALIYQNVGLRTLELGLLYNWLRLATLNRGYGEHRFAKVSSDLEPVTRRLISELKALEAELDDEGPTPAMASLGTKVQQVREQFGDVTQAHLPLPEIERQTAKTMEALFGFTAECLNQAMHPGLLESAMLYYWLRASTVTASVPEAFFQKLERHWPTVVKRVGRMMDKLLLER
jgi:hypothetical protein